MGKRTGKEKSFWYGQSQLRIANCELRIEADLLI
jgi:hypothetical protein